MSNTPTKRTRQILPLGVPPSQSVPSSSSLSNEHRTPLRISRACNTCRRQKMRCEGLDGGSACSRCQTAGVECVFENVPANKPPTVPTTSRLSSLEDKMELLQSTQLQMQQSIQEILIELRSCLKIFKRLDSDSELLNLPRKRRRRDIQETIESDDISDIPNRPSNMSINNFIFTTTPPSPDSSPNASNMKIPKSPKHLSDPATPSTRATCSPELQACVQPAQPLTMVQNQSQSLPMSLEPSTVRDAYRHREVSIVKPFDARSVIREDKSHGWNPRDQSQNFHIIDASYPDPVERALITIDDAESLFELFFDKCHPRMPIFDPRIDTFQSLRQRSVFCFCCILMVAVRARDGGSPTPLQDALWDEAMARAKASMFHRVADLEVIQSLLLLAAWSESTGGTCWIVTGHAIRCAVEMGIHKALTKLSGALETDSNEKTQILVSSARVWCALFAFGNPFHTTSRKVSLIVDGRTSVLSFGIGRHTMTGHHKSIKNARDILLHHPLSQLSDARLVFACEIMILEYQLLETLPTTDADDSRCQAHLQEARTRMDQWFTDWDALVGKHYPIDHYMRQSLRIHKEYGYMTLHMAGMPRIITSADLDKVSPNERLNCVYAVSAAREIVKISVEEPSYRDGLRYSPTCFFSGVSFTGALLLRLGIVLKGEEEIIEGYTVKLFRVLLDVPTCRFKFQFVSLLKEKGLIPKDSPGDQEPVTENQTQD